MTFAGYPHLNNSILGVVHEVGEDGQPSEEPALAQDEKPFTTLGFANGPGSLFYEEEDEEAQPQSGGAGTDQAVMRPTVTEAEAEATDYLQQALVPLESETHGGSDVAAYAVGSRASLVRGVVEQSYLFQVMDYALNLTKRAQGSSSNSGGGN
jgi:alkaline phosphatase